MEVRINKEIRSYTESIFFGLNLRQCVCAALAIAAALGIYFGFGERFGRETVSWLCVLGALPFGVLGFVKYNGMPAEKLILAFVRSELLMPKRLMFRPTNLYYEMMKPTIQKYEKEAAKHHD